MLLVGRYLKKYLKEGTITVRQENGIEETFGKSKSGFPDVTVRLADEDIARRIIRAPKICTAEAFMSGKLVVEKGDIMDLVTLERANDRWENYYDTKEPDDVENLDGDQAGSSDAKNDQTRARESVAHHYDIGNDFYRLFLDDDMQYSCAYWRDGVTSLEQAQRDKKAHIAAKLDLKAGQRVLDIGCGWGGMAIYLHEQFGVDVTGITLSEEQLKFAEESAKAKGVQDHVNFLLMDYRDLAAEQPGGFDRIVSVAMFENVGQPQFETFFRCANKLMTDDGVMLLHTIGRLGPPGITDAFTRTYIFPGGHLPALSETLTASEKAHLITSDVETLRMHYASTLREWYRRAVSNETEITAMYNEQFYRMWIFYLSDAAAAFESGELCNYQIQFSRNRRTLPLTRDYIGETEKNLLA